MKSNRVYCSMNSKFSIFPNWLVDGGGKNENKLGLLSCLKYITDNICMYM